MQREVSPFFATFELTRRELTFKHGVSVIELGVVFAQPSVTPFGSFGLRSGVPQLALEFRDGPPSSNELGVRRFCRLGVTRGESESLIVTNKNIL